MIARSALRLPLLLVGLCAAIPAPAQQGARTVAAPGTAGGDGAAVRSLRAARAAGVRVDGRLDEAAWAAAEVAGGFVQQRPREGAPASQPTQVRVLYDDQAVYVGARMADAHPDSIAAQLARRDASGIYSDWFHVVIDSYHDRRTGFRFAVNPLGVQKDVMHSNDGNEDVSWDAVWEVATSRDSAGWTAEFRIPLSQLRFGRGTAGQERVWGINFLRDIARVDERSYWSAVPANYPGFMSRAGDLAGLAGIATPRRLEVLPYTSARLTRDPVNPSDPFSRANAFDPSVGADVRMGLPGGLTLTGTINPDFGQVEVDPAVVNLSAFETFYPEKRPFFVEGSDIFGFGSLNSFNTFGSPTFFYTRRVGRSPHRSLAGEFGYADEPSQSTILGAAKVSGKTPGGWSVGVLDAVTALERGTYLDDGGVRRTAPVEPLSNYFVGRLRRDFQGGRTVVGGLVTSAYRDLRGDPVLEGGIRSGALTSGLDFEHAWGEGRAWSLTGFFAGSRVSGSADAMLRTQLSSARYYQRPDQAYMRVDSSATSLSGWNDALAVQHAGSYDLSLAFQETSPGFESNDLGFQRSADRRAFSTFLGRRVNKPGKVLRSHSYYAYSNAAWDFGGNAVYNQVSAGTNGTLHSLWNAGVTATYGFATKDVALTRGGPIARSPQLLNVSLNWGSDPRKRFSANGYVSNQQDEAGGRSRYGNVYFNLRPSASVQVSAGPSLSRDLNAAQYVTTVPDALATGTYGARYVFGDLRQTTLAMDTRVDWTFTPRLSLQLFAQPFVSSGQFSRYKEFARRGTLDFDVYGRDRGTIAEHVDGDGNRSFTVDPDGVGAAAPFTLGDQDFTVRSLRGNAVVRWEYRPGSALFFVWQQERFGGLGDGRFDAGRDLRGLFREPAHNVFLIKATYWLNR
jgi:hypothetical protein